MLSSLEAMACHPLAFLGAREWWFRDYSTIVCLICCFYDATDWGCEHILSKSCKLQDSTLTQSVPVRWRDHSCFCPSQDHHCLSPKTLLAAKLHLPERHQLGWKYDLPETRAMVKTSAWAFFQLHVALETSAASVGAPNGSAITLSNYLKVGVPEGVALVSPPTECRKKLSESGFSRRSDLKCEGGLAAASS